MSVRALTAWAIAVLVLVLASCSGGSSRQGGGTSVFKLKVGTCVVPPTAVKAEISSLTTVPCSSPHTQEVFATIVYTGLTTPGSPSSGVPVTGGENFPGDKALRTFADGHCLQQYAAYVGVDYRDSSLFYTYLLPSGRSWTSKDRTIICLITTTGQPLTMSVKGSRR